MSCNDVASILDHHRTARLAPAERAAADEHLSTCADCAAAWHAQTELLALPMPPLPASLLDRALLASQAPQREPSRARLGLVVGSALLAGAALASVAVMSLMREPSAPSVPAVDSAPETAPVAAPQEVPPDVATSASASPNERTTSVELVETALSIAPIVLHPPTYPAEALAQGLKGHVQVKFDVTAAGVVENLIVVESSDERFEASALEAVAGWRYLPRIVAGKRVRSDGIHTVIRFDLGGDSARVDAQAERAREEALREFTEFSAALEVALDRLVADELRGAELQLDEMQAVYGTHYPDLWSFYGYLFTVQGNYDRAIDAYEKAVSAFARVGSATSGPYVPLANLYFARHQYDLALKTLLRPNLPGGNRVLGAEANALLQKLNALGVTAESIGVLEPR